MQTRYPVLWQQLTAHTHTLARPCMHLLCRRGRWWHPGWHQPGQNGRGASCGGRWAGPWPWRCPAVAGGSSPARSRPAPGRNAFSWPDVGAGQWGGTPAGTGQSPCSGGIRYIAGNNLEAAEEKRQVVPVRLNDCICIMWLLNNGQEIPQRWDKIEYNKCSLLIWNEEAKNNTKIKYTVKTRNIQVNIYANKQQMCKGTVF